MRFRVRIEVEPEVGGGHSIYIAVNGKVATDIVVNQPMTDGIAEIVGKEVRKILAEVAVRP